MHDAIGIDSQQVAVIREVVNRAQCKPVDDGCDAGGTVTSARAGGSKQKSETIAMNALAILVPKQEFGNEGEDANGAAILGIRYAPGQLPFEQAWH